MIGRIWHGYTTHQNADFINIRNRHIPGFHEIQLFRRDLGNEVEFITIMWFDDIESVKAFAGEEYETAVVPPRARAVLSRFDERSQHYEMRERLMGA